MTQALIRGWREHARRASEWQSGEAPDAVLEALALSVALELTGDLAYVPQHERDRLRQLGQRALLHLGALPGEDEEDVEARRLCAVVARDGLRALASRTIPVEPELEALSVSGVALVPPSEVRRLLSAELDGFASGSLAMRIRRSKQALGELRWMRRMGQPEERAIRLAAAEAIPVLDPAMGRVVGRLEALGAEAVLFEGAPRRLAVYAEEPHALRLVAAELTTEDVREGYWIGRIADDAERVDATLHAGEQSVPWILMLD
jgi:hypothetical protein